MEQTDREALEQSSDVNGTSDVGRRRMIEAKLQEIVQDINDNRKQHTNVFAEFKTELAKQVRTKN